MKRKYNLNTAYFIIGADFTWHRGMNLYELQKRYLKNGSVKIEHIIYQMVFEHCTNEEAEQMLYFFFVDGLGGITQRDDLTNEQEAMLNQYFNGWIITKYTPKVRKEKAGKKTEAIH